MERKHVGLSVVFTQMPILVFGYLPPKKSKFIGHTHLKHFNFEMCKNL